MSTVNSQFFRLKHNMIVQSVMKGIWKMQNYHYRSSGNSRGCMRQPDSRRDNTKSDTFCDMPYQDPCNIPCQDPCNTPYQDSCSTPHRQMNNQELCAGIALDQMPVTMAYVPWTKWRNIYEAEKGLRRGTIFQDLDKPFRGIGGCQNGR